MLKLEATTKLSPEEAVKKAVKYFGEGHGLKVNQISSCCVQFEGGGGGVEVTASPKGKGATVELESREWDYQVKEFIRQIK
jgi:hypothetical protein